MFLTYSGHKPRITT